MNCKVGDLAIVIDALFPENVGLLVEVLAPGDAAPDITLPHWHCRVTGDRAIKYQYVRSEDVGIAADVFFYDHQLRPIRPGELPMTVEAPAPAVTA